MPLVVQKFGGTSVGSLERISHVADIVQRTRQQGHDVVVVVSAMHGETDRLIDLAMRVASDPDPREFDALVATGEQVSAALVSMMLCSKGCPAISLNGSQASIRTDAQHRKARIINIDTQALQKCLSSGRVPVVAGFQGVTDKGLITTIGRGGSDITAVALAAALKADECQIFTDVDGVYTSDPRVVKGARRIDEISFDEMIEMASLGAKVLQIRSVQFAEKFGVSLRVLSSFEEGPGTLITFAKQEPLEPKVSGIAFDRNQAKISVCGIPNQSSVIAKILASITANDIEVDMMIQNVPSPDELVDFSFTVHLDDYRDALKVAEQLGQQLRAREVCGNDHIAKLSVVGLGMKSHASVAAKMLAALSDEGIPIHLISSSEVKISTVIDEKYMELGARTLHSAFHLDLVYA